MTIIDYVAEPTPAKFHLSDAFVRGMMGPIGSGKSVACCHEIFRKSLEQKPFFESKNKRGIRRNRWVIIRNTYRELQDTTKQTWFDWFPVQMGKMHKMDEKFVIHQYLPDNTIHHLEVLFRALDKPNDIKKLLSLELTGGWMNEAREIPKAVLDMLIGRLGRYPSQRQGGPTWYGAILDTNPPDEDHWWYKLFEEQRPDTYKLFRQPSGLSKDAENLQNLPRGYYTNMQAGKDQQWIDVYVHGKYGFVVDGRPIWEEYQDDVHFAPDGFMVPHDSTIAIGIDFGLTPAATLGYKNEFGQWLIFDEIVTESMGAVNFAKVLGQRMREEWPYATFEIYGDPAGEQRSQTDETTPFEILNAAGINAIPAPTNDFTLRREAVANALTRLAFNGKPGLIIGPRCKNLRKAMSGGYKYKRMQVSGDERYQDKPDKNMYSHVAESLQYMLVGQGEDLRVIGASAGWGNPIDYSEIDKGVI